MHVRVQNETNIEDPNRFCTPKLCSLNSLVFADFPLWKQYTFAASGFNLLMSTQLL